MNLCESDIGAILALRADSNVALLAHDADRVLLHTTDDFILVGGTSGGHVGKSVVRRYYIDGFAAPDLVTYVRTPDQATVSDAGDRATERGKWQGVWRSPKTGSRRISRSLDEEGWRLGHSSRGLRHLALHRPSLRALM
jgi:ketosteroid isomerase-like protein